LTDQNYVDAILNHGMDSFYNTMRNEMFERACAKAKHGTTSGTIDAVNNEVFVNGGTLDLLGAFLSQGHLHSTAKWELGKSCDICLRNTKNEYWDEILLKDHWRGLPEDWEKHVKDDFLLLSMLTVFNSAYNNGMLQEYMVYVRWSSPDECRKCSGWNK
jgi:hypothetical protein